LQIYGTAVNVVSHVTDIWRVDFMVKYGGIYVDTDVVFVRPLDRHIRGYDAVGAYDWTYWNHPFPDTINFGVALGKRNAPYWHKFQVSRVMPVFR
jgi:mannosyltransferase OCH1-like enzyme